MSQLDCLIKQMIQLLCRDLDKGSLQSQIMNKATSFQNMEQYPSICMDAWQWVCNSEP